LTYDSFDYIGSAGSNEISLSDHVKRILEIGWSGILVAIDQDPELLSNLSIDNASAVVNRTQHHLGHLTQSEFESTLDALRSQGSKVQGFLSKHKRILQTVGVLINAVLKAAYRLDLSSLAMLTEQPSPSLADHNRELRLLISVAKELRFRAIYVLVDRVDESESTGNDPVRSFKLIEPMVKSLQLLETPGIAFKFFLWDVLRKQYMHVARPDRIPDELLEWDRQTLLEMLQKRLRTFSNGNIWTLASVCEPLRNYRADEIAVLFANGSPRDLIRLCARIVTEQEELDSSRTILTKDAVYRGIDNFSRTKCEFEIFANRAKHLTSFQRIGAHSNHVDFTIPYLASEVFKETSSGSGNRIREWKKHGFIRELGTIAAGNKNRGRKVKLFITEDIRLARFMVQRLTTQQFLESKVMQCSECFEYNIRDIGDADSNGICSSCYFDWVHRIQFQAHEIVEDEDEEEQDGPTLPMFPDLD